MTRRALGFFGAAAGAALLGAEAATLPPGVRLLSDVAYLSADRAEKLDIYLPPERSGGGADRAAPAKLRAAIVYFHGGGWVRGDKADARERNIGGHLAAAGYVFVSTNYLLGPQAWPRNLQDCKNAVRFLRAQRLGAVPRSFDALVDYLNGHGNDLTEPAIACAPVVGEVLNALRALPGARLARMSGSGATCFALFATAAEAEAAAAMLAGRGWWVAATTLVAAS